MKKFWVIASLALASSLCSNAEQCGWQADGALCPGGLCCGTWGWCGTTAEYCDVILGCQSNCWSPPHTPTPIGKVEDIITHDLFETMLLHRNDPSCPANGFYTYDAFIAAADSFYGFGTTGDNDTRKMELASFFGQTSHETGGGDSTAPDWPFAWGYCHVEEIYIGEYCVPNELFPCAPGKKYFGRGPIQLSYNYNYGQAGKALDLDLLNDPDQVTSDPIIAFKTAIWFWMTPQAPKTSCHSVLTGAWLPSASDKAAGRAPGYGLTTNIINGGQECGHGPDQRVEKRIGFYKRYCGILESYGENLDCNNQKPFGTNKLVFDE